MRRSILLLGVLFAAGCGARTELAQGHASPAELDAAADCQKQPWILFDYYDGLGQGGIWAMRLDGSELHRLEIKGKGARSPSISPDGASLLYVDGVSDQDESLLIRELATGKTHTLLHTSVEPPSTGLGKATLSPNRKWVAYGNHSDLNLIEFDGSNDHVLVDGPYQAGCCGWGYGHPVFSADSATVYFSTIGRLESIGVDGSGRVLLEQDQFMSNPAIPGFVFPNASLSPDYTRLVAQIGCDVGELRVYTIGSLPADPCSTGTKIVETHLSSASNEAANPAWGPTGLIAYDDGPDVWVVDAKGGAPQNLTAKITSASGHPVANPVWAPGCVVLP